jgi:short-subunit dehydrogenase
MELDVTDRKQVFDCVNIAINYYKRIDILVSNAGFGHFGSVEEMKEEEMRKQMEINFFGSFNIIQAVLPLMRQRKSGHIFQVTSMGGMATFMFNGAYSATKWALEGLCETLAKEMEGTGVKVTIIEPGAFGTNFINAVGFTPFNIEPYATRYKEFMKMSENMMSAAENPKDAAQQVLNVVLSENPPLRLALGHGISDVLIKASKERIEVWEENER